MSKLDDLLEGFDLEGDQESGISFRIQGSNKIRQKVLETLHGANARMSRVGPYTDSTIHPKVDLSRFLFTGFLPTDNTGE